MKKALLAVFVLALLAGAVALIYFDPLYRGPEKETPPVVEEQPPQEEKAPPVRYAVEEPLPPEVPSFSEEAAPPPPQERPETFQEGLAVLFGQKTLRDLFHLDHFIERFVVTVDNVLASQVPRKFLPLQAPKGRFLVSGGEGDEIVSPYNYRRYAPYVRIAEALDAEKAVALYVRFYPRFQKAYREMGYTSGHFNDRLTEVLDHLLATPEVEEPIRLVRPRVLHEYADPELEALSGGQKALIRTGSENAAALKAKLRQIRAELLERTASSRIRRD
ncbi:DUF3014 domain-containing protein [uncultured Desulfuromonas sp.]|uniref:DUF3014 domain-containing protein n=1 Tax=uncultured Desulfuromonas sp. TaxID=181013 RepID=UPI00262A61F6|nr:DUF3014 domain-containing protein [uncultured Desulfuromonas sp.]